MCTPTVTFLMTRCHLVININYNSTNLCVSRKVYADLNNININYIGKLLLDLVYSKETIEGYRCFRGNLEDVNKHLFIRKLYYRTH